ncbi:MFS transporter [Corynebacterium lubricantis]|uniref:MFS transporter n=1 Tax=Corynebacterium lubricantis TaxID=541095 RepID=UPI00037B2918|nr:MFS transporter [Corynebacterium lubricantis]
MPVVMLFLAVFTAAINLRAGMASVGAVLDEVIAYYDAPASLAGVITAMPGAFFCIMGLGAVPLARRTGITPTIFGGAVLTLFGLALRPYAPTISLFIVCTVGVVAGVAVANVLLPVWVKQYGGKHMVALMTVYSGVLGLSAALGPLSRLITENWQGALGFWAIPSALQVVVWIYVVAKFRVDIPRGSGTDSELYGSLWRSPTAVSLMLFFGLQSMNGYVQMGWLPVILKDAGVDDSTAATALSVVGFCGILGGLTLPTVIARSRTLTPWVLVFGLATAGGYLGLLVAPAAAPLLWAVVLGVGGWCFPLAVALIPARTRSPLVTAKLSGFVQPYGYVVAAVGPMLIGVAYGILGSFQAILIVLIILGVLLGLLGVTAARNVYIDDELAAQR